MGFIAIIFCIFIVWFMGYLVYHQFIAPVKNIIEASEKKKKAELIAEKGKMVLKDKIFLERIAPIKKALENNEITNERFEEIFIELFKERTNEMFKNDEDYDNEDYDNEDYDNEDYDDEDYDNEDYDNEDYDDEDYDNEDYDDEDYDDEDYDDEDYDDEDYDDEEEK